MTTKQRLAPAFKISGDRPGRRRTAPLTPDAPDFSGISRSMESIFTDLFNFFETASPATPELSTSNEKDWSPFSLHFSWLTPRGEVNIPLRDAVSHFIDTISGFAPPSVVCDTTNGIDGRITFRSPEQALALLQRLVEKHPRIKDPQGAVSTNPQAQTRVLKAGDFVSSMPSRAYLSGTDAYAQALNSRRLQAASPDVYLLSLGRIANQIALVRHQPLPHPLLAVQ